jgi:hypothetical protein
MGECSCNFILDLGTRQRWMIRFKPWPFYRRKRSHDTHCIGGWLGSTVGLDAVEKRKISCHCPELNPGLPACSPSLYRLSYPQHYSSNSFNIGRIESFHWTRFYDNSAYNSWRDSLYYHTMSFSAQDFPESGLQWVSENRFIRQVSTCRKSNINFQ